MVTVIMPVYNCEQYIETAIRSVMAQTYTDWTMLVVNDGSTDTTCSIVQNLSAEDARIVLVHNIGEKGVAGARNHGLDMCSSEYVAFIDGDDIWEPCKLEMQLRAIQQENADMSYTSYAIVDESGNRRKRDYIVPRSTTFEQMLRENVVGCSTVIISRELARKYRFSAAFYHEDYCLWLEILQAGHKAIGCPEVLAKWRLISDSRSFDKKKSAVNRWRIYRQHLKLSPIKSIKAFLGYIICGIRKYVR